MSKKPKKTLVSQSTLAQMAGVSRQAVGLAKDKFSAAMSGKKVDLANPLVQAWLAEAKGRAAAGLKTGPKPKDNPAPERPKRAAPPRAPSSVQSPAAVDLPDDDGDDPGASFDALNHLESMASDAGIMSTEEVEAIPNMTLNEIYNRFGTQEAFKDLMAARKLIPEIRMKDVQAEEKRGEYIPRSVVKKYIIPLIDNGNKRLVEDMPQTLAAKAIKLVKSGDDVTAIAEKFRADISKVLKDIKTDALRHMDA